MKIKNLFVLAMAALIVGGATISCKKEPKGGECTENCPPLKVAKEIGNRKLSYNAQGNLIFVDTENMVTELIYSGNDLTKIEIQGYDWFTGEPKDYLDAEHLFSLSGSTLTERVYSSENGIMGTEPTMTYVHTLNSNNRIVKTVRTYSVETLIPGEGVPGTEIWVPLIDWDTGEPILDGSGEPIYFVDGYTEWEDDIEIIMHHVDTTDYTYDARGNMSTKKFVQTTAVEGSGLAPQVSMTQDISYTYDLKETPLRDCFPAWFLQTFSAESLFTQQIGNRNNMVQNVSLSSGGGGGIVPLNTRSEQFISNYTYDYDADDFPVTMYSVFEEWDDMPILEFVY